jgi:uncharacterized protein (TIGR02266 family)
MIHDEGRRIEERVTINQEFESLGAFVREYVTNISRSGAFLRCNDPLPIGTKIKVTFLVIDDEVESVEAVGEVVRVQNDPPGMGVVFTQIDAKSDAVLERMLEKAKAARVP